MPTTYQFVRLRTFGGSHSPSIDNAIDKHKRWKSEPNALTIQVVDDDHIRRKKRECWMTSRARRVCWAGFRGASNEKGGIQARRDTVSLKARNPEQVLTCTVLVHPIHAHIDRRGLQPHRTSTTIGRTTTTAHLVVLLPSFEDTAAIRALTDNQHTGRTERQQKLTIIFGLRHSAAS